MLAISPARSPGASAGHALASTTMFPCSSRWPSHQPSSMFTYLYPAFFIPVETIASAWLTITCESTVFEKLFHDDQPIGGGGRAAGFCAFRCADPATRARAIAIPFDSVTNLNPRSLIASPGSTQG